MRTKIAHYHQKLAPGGGGVLSIMHGLTKTGGPIYTEKRKIEGPGPIREQDNFGAK